MTLESSAQLKNWEEYRGFMKERLKLLSDGAAPVFISKEKIDFEINGKPWRGRAVLIDKKSEVVVQRLRKEGLIFREGMCRARGETLEIEGIPAKLVKDSEKTFKKLLLGYEPLAVGPEVSDEDAGHDGGHAHEHHHEEGDREARRQTAPFTATADPLLKQLWAELVKLGPAIKAATDANASCKGTLTAQVKKASDCFKNKETAELQAVLERAKNLLAEVEKINRLAAHIDKLISSAGWSSDDDRVRAITKGLTRAQIQNLPTATRNRMMASLQSGNFSGDDKDALKKLYSVNYLDPVFEAKDEKNRKALVAKIGADPDFKKAKKDWSTMPAADKVRIMQKMADMQAEIYGIPRTTIATFDKGTHKGNDGKTYITEGYYNHKDGKLHMNTNNSSSFGDFGSAMSTLTHENAHRYQSTLVDQLKAGKIKKGDPLYDQAVTFQLNDGYYTDDKPEYFTQPMETHSRVTGAAIDEALQAL